MYHFIALLIYIKFINIKIVDEISPKNSHTSMSVKIVPFSVTMNCYNIY